MMLSEVSYELKTDVTVELPDGCVMVQTSDEQYAMAFEEWLAETGWAEFLKFYNGAK